MKTFSTKKLVILSVLAASEIVLARTLSLNVWNSRIGFSFIPSVLAAMLYGPLSAGLVSGLADLIGSMLFPVGPYFPGFTLSAVLSAMVYGFILYPRRSFPRIAAAVFISQFVFSFLLNSFWISILYGSSFSALLSTRILQQCFYIPVKLLVIPVLSELLSRIRSAEVMPSYHQKLGEN